MVMQAENTTNNEEQVVDQVVENQEQVVVEEQKVEAPAITAEQYAEVQQKLKEYEQRLQAVDPLVKQVEDQRARAESDRVEALARGIEEASDASDAPLSTEDKNELREVIKAGYEYRKMSQSIQEERVAAHALNYAARHLGPGATISQWQGLANKLLDLGDPRLMEAYIRELGEMTKTNTQAEQRRTADTRRETGVDRPITSPVGSGGLMSVDAIIDKYNRVGLKGLTDGEVSFWMADRKSRGQPVIRT